MKVACNRPGGAGTPHRQTTRPVSVGGVRIGGGAPVAIQSMTKTLTADVRATVRQIHKLEAAGCEIVRCAVPDVPSAEALRAIKRQVHIPIVADIHFDHRLAIAAVNSGADKIRINPGNIGGAERVRAVLEAARHARIPVRIGLNTGSVRHVRTTPEQSMLATLDAYLRLFHRCDFEDIVISVKASDVPATIRMYRAVAARYRYPLHIGITESGPPGSGSIKSAVGLGVLLADGIGDTLRVSLTGDPVEEVRVGWEIVRALHLRRYQVNLISCPTCGRCASDVVGIAQRLERMLADVKTQRPLTVAVMGCAVNGPGEAKAADLGVAMGKGRGMLFVRGKPVRVVSQRRCIGEVLRLIHDIDGGREGL
jgi:(E)-4-hydroxy-3-methylbut-2-enyl-diphosphate synthase